MKVNVCHAILSKGKRKGEQCNRRTFSIEHDELFCKLHTAKPTEQNTCSMILLKGKRKNHTCNRKVVTGSDLCKIHHDIELKKPYNPYVDQEFPIEFTEDGITSSSSASSPTASSSTESSAAVTSPVGFFKVHELDPTLVYNLRLCI